MRAGAHFRSPYFFFFWAKDSLIWVMLAITRIVKKKAINSSSMTNTRALREFGAISPSPAVVNVVTLKYRKVRKSFAKLSG